MTSNDKGPPGLLYPFMEGAFSKGVLVALVPALIASVISRAPQNRLSKVLGQDIGIPADAIILILVAPFYFFIVTWLLMRAGERTGRGEGVWTRSDVLVLKGLVVLLAATALFLLSQFFLILAPAGTCDQRPHFDVLWSSNWGDQQIEHCMSTAKEINGQAWWYFRPIVVQAWLYALLVGASLIFLRRGWRAWRVRVSVERY